MHVVNSSCPRHRLLPHEPLLVSLLEIRQNRLLPVETKMLIVERRLDSREYTAEKRCRREGCNV